MKYILSYGIWFAAVASYALLFFMPDNRFIPYANRTILIYEIFCWFMFFLLSLFNVFFIFGKVSVISKKGYLDKSKKDELIKAMQSLSKKWYQILFEYLHYVFIIFIGVFIGDISMTIILILNAVQFIFLKKHMVSFIKRLSNE